MAEPNTTTGYLDATLLERSLLRNARLRTPYGMQEGVPAYTTETEGMMLHDLTLAGLCPGSRRNRPATVSLAHGPDPCTSYVTVCLRLPAIAMTLS